MAIRMPRRQSDTPTLKMVSSVRRRLRQLFFSINGRCRNTASPSSYPYAGRHKNIISRTRVGMAMELSFTGPHLIFCDGEASFGPAAPTAIHGDHFGVAHLLKIVGGEGGAEAAAAIQHHGRRAVGYALLDITLDDALAEVNGAGQVTACPFAFLAHVHHDHFFAGVEELLPFGTIGFADARLRVLHQFQEAGRVLHDESSEKIEAFESRRSRG